MLISIVVMAYEFNSPGLNEASRPQIMTNYFIPVRQIYLERSFESESSISVVNEGHLAFEPATTSRSNWKMPISELLTEISSLDHTSFYFMKACQVYSLTFSVE